MSMNIAKMLCKVLLVCTKAICVSIKDSSYKKYEGAIKSLDKNFKELS